MVRLSTLLPIVVVTSALFASPALAYETCAEVSTPPLFVRFCDFFKTLHWKSDDEWFAITKVGYENCCENDGVDCKCPKYEELKDTKFKDWCEEFKTLCNVTDSLESATVVLMDGEIKI
eukprot:CAMPEP_0195522854 /NCGR_PEP_ID=MMETSP0794_2-20130614/21422_1 /TAXON_ID=515487 /ORGANISM="Stephanopyxis turris, Strain CCMP 815" /LENGTH=118 /DNA_ID=CAMNT_0040652707 /DNA_START=29 /DNA_END=385 /DNA_ORIENTATION=+